MKYAAIIALILCSITGCKKKASPPGTPSCIEETIQSNKNNSNWPIGRISEYEYQGKLVYTFEPDQRIADASTRIYTDSCAPLCQVGGFGGPNVAMCNGENFYQKAVLKRIIWGR
jgi:hypothetical protein